MSLDLPRDAEQLARLGIDAEEARRQLARLASPPPPPQLDRPCTLGDGIRRLEPEAEPTLSSAWEEAARTGRFTKFVPASGAASRMFAAAADALEGEPPGRSELAERRDAGDPVAAEVVELLDRVADLPFFAQLARVLDLSPAELVERARSDDYPTVLGAILSDDGLGYAERPKALIPFHRYEDGSRTPFEEHLVEGAGYLRDGNGVCRFHFTVPAQDRALFEARVSRLRSRAWHPSISLSVQHPSTDTLALEADGRPARLADGSLLLRPGGHGALIHNLDAADGDLVYVKNVDNVLPEPRQTPVVVWQRVLGGLAVTLRRRIDEAIERLSEAPTPDDVEAADALCRLELGWDATTGEKATRRGELLRRLDRPLRVCGVVPNTGEPGGGPFWVRGADSPPRPQIVEAAQVALDDPRQAEIWRASTHFNPVMLVAAVRKPSGARYRLTDFVDLEAVLVSEKPHLDRRLRVLEHPGLWNGAMAGWNSVFVEVPLETFAPVKTVVDLLRPEHQL